MPELPSYVATRYVQPLREGGTLPAVVDTHGGGLFVAKFRGAGQGAKALVAELLVGLIAQAIDLPVPEIALIEVLADFGRSEPDPEIQDLLKASVGINVGLRYLDGAFNFQAAAAGEFITPELAARIVWLDAFTTNPDRTARNPNLLIWNRKPWLIDHGAAVYAQHNWPGVDEARTRTPFPLIKDHVLLRISGDLEAADAEIASRLQESVIRDVVASLPEALLQDPAIASKFPDPDAARARYADHLCTRIQAPRAFVAPRPSRRARRCGASPRPASRAADEGADSLDRVQLRGAVRGSAPAPGHLRARGRAAARAHGGVPGHSRGDGCVGAGGTCGGRGRGTPLALPAHPLRHLQRGIRRRPRRPPPALGTFPLVHRAAVGRTAV